MDSGTAAAAAGNGQLSCLQFLHENGCPWDEHTPSSAAANVHINCLQYALEHNCRLEPSILQMAVKTVTPASLQCLEYLHLKRGIPFLEGGQEFEAAVMWGNHFVLQYLIDQGCPYLSCRFEDDGSYYYALFISSFMLDDLLYEYDCNFVKCIKFLVHKNWNFEENGKGLLKFVTRCSEKLPLSAEFLVSNNIV